MDFRYRLTYPSFWVFISDIEAMQSNSWSVSFNVAMNSLKLDKLIENMINLP